MSHLHGLSMFIAQKKVNKNMIHIKSYQGWLCCVSHVPALAGACVVRRRLAPLRWILPPRSSGDQESSQRELHVITLTQPNAESQALKATFGCHGRAWQRSEVVTFRQNHLETSLQNIANL